jgi:uncharacterized Zn finger protein
MEQKEGKCPRCGRNLKYGHSAVRDKNVARMIYCSCGYTGYEWYKLVFDEQIPEK